MNRKYKMIKPESDDYSFFGFFAAVQGTAPSPFLHLRFVAGGLSVI